MDLIEREFIGRKLEATFDKQGRVTLPPHLVQYARLDGLSEVTVIGIRNRIEIWNPKVYDEIRTEKEQVIQGLRQKIRMSS